ncbi:MAG TPA: cyanophycin synthetase, partial [Planctomycetota bacterium]
LLARARELGGELLELPDAAPGRADLPQPQAHSRRDFALARAMLADLGAHGHDACVVAAKALDTLPAGALRLPGRWELGTTEDGRPVVFDVAHTPASIAAVLGAFRRAWPQARRGIVMGLRADKDLAAVRAAIGPPQAGEAWFACHAGDHPLSADPLAVAAAFGAQPLARPELPPGPEVLLVTGSSYLVGLLRARRAAPALQ